MSLTSPATQPEPRQTTLKGLKLPITIEHFRSLEPRQQNDLVSEQVMGWQLYEWDEECSQFTPGAEWQYGSDYNAVSCTLWAPGHLDAMLEDDDMALLHWEETYGSRDWVADVGAAVKLLEPLADQEPVLCRYTPTSLVSWTCCCKIMKPRNRKALYGPLAGVPGNRISSRYSHRLHTWLIEATHSTQDGEETDAWQTQYRDGHYVFQAV